MARIEVLGDPTEDIAAMYKQEAAAFPLLSVEEERKLGRGMERGKIVNMFRRAIDKRENGFVPLVASEVMTTRVLMQTGLSPYIGIVLSEEDGGKKKKGKTVPDNYKHITPLSKTVGGIAINNWQGALGRLADPIVKRYFDDAEENAKIAREQFITANLRLVPKIAAQRRYMGKGLEFNDRIQEGNDGVIEAVDHFKWWLGFKFSSNATNWIGQRIQRGINGYNGKRTVSKGEIRRINSFTNEFFDRHGYNPSVDEIASALEIPRLRVFELVDLSRIGHPASYDKSIKNGEGELYAMRDLIPDATSVEDETTNVVLVELLTSCLDSREGYIIRRYYLDGLTDEEIKNEIGETSISRTRVSQIRRRALGKMNKAFNNGIEKIVMNEQRDLATVV